MKYLDYRKKLGIGFDDEKLLTLMLKRWQILYSVLNNNFHSCFSSDFSFYFYSTFEVPDINRTCDIRGVWDNILSSESFKDVVAKIVVLINLPDEVWNHSSAKSFVSDYFFKTLDDLNVKYKKIEDKDGVFVFPKGAAELDDALVSENLEWLKDYPKARNELIQSLKDYSKSRPENASKVADSFRKALETFFKEFFDKNKSLENMKSEYGNYLKERGVPKEITNNFETLLKLYTDFNNSYAKHSNNTQTNVLEFIMYQTGNIIRLLCTLKESKS